MTDDLEVRELITRFEAQTKDLLRAQDHVRQFSLERAYTALALYEQGFKHHEVAELLNVSQPRVTQLVGKARADRERLEIKDLARRARAVPVASRIRIVDAR
jgi:predicted XRE-type DNA-binding protein